MAKDKDFNLDPISKEPGSHPVGTGLGAVAGGAAVGAAAGAVGGPVGAAVGAVVGAVAGGLGGKAAAEAFNPTAEEAYWKANYDKEPYYQEGRVYEDYAPAYQMGMYGRTRFGEDYAAAERDLSANWDAHRQNSARTWPEVSAASRAAWDRVDTQSRDAAPPASAASTTSSEDTARTDRMDYATTTTATTSASTTSDLTGSNYRMAENDLNTDTMANADTRSADVMGRDDVLETLNDLVECCRDGEYGFRQCAEYSTDSEVQMVLTKRAVDCEAGAVELRELIQQYGGEVDKGGTSSGALHRGWVSVKGTLSGYSTQAMLNECERGEDAALSRYRKALKQNLPDDVRRVVERQAEGVKRNHDQIKAMRDTYKSKS